MATHQRSKIGHCLKQQDEYRHFSFWFHPTTMLSTQEKNRKLICSMILLLPVIFRKEWKKARHWHIIRIIWQLSGQNCLRSAQSYPLPTQSFLWIGRIWHIFARLYPLLAVVQRCTMPFLLLAFQKLLPLFSPIFSFSQHCILFIWMPLHILRWKNS